jgi:hypothetical protein
MSTYSYLHAAVLYMAEVQVPVQVHEGIPMVWPPQSTPPLPMSRGNPAAFLTLGTSYTLHYTYSSWS